MNEAAMIPREMARITCMAHHLLVKDAAKCLSGLKVRSVWVENARCVRFRIKKRAFGFSGTVARLDDSPMDIFRMTVPRGAAVGVMNALMDALELRVPGHGMLYSQDVIEYSRTETNSECVKGEPDHSSLLRDIALLTCILSMPNSGEHLAGVALNLGAGLPVISRGAGSGLRDRLGLLRIVIPPEKEILRLVVPAHDADSIRNMLVEEGRMNRPGGGFIYQTPITEGIIDTLLRIGPQGHPASMEQIISAVDDLKGGTSWRRRFSRVDKRSDDVDRQVDRDYRELTFMCPEGRADGLVRVALDAGAGGATTSLVRSLRGGSGGENGGAHAHEMGMLCVQSALSDAVVKVLCEVLSECDQTGCRVQILEAPSAFPGVRH